MTSIRNQLLLFTGLSLISTVSIGIFALHHAIRMDIKYRTSVKTIVPIVSQYNDLYFLIDSHSNAIRKILRAQDLHSDQQTDISTLETQISERYDNVAHHSDINVRLLEKDPDAYRLHLKLRQTYALYLDYRFSSHRILNLLALGRLDQSQKEYDVLKVLQSDIRSEIQQVMTLAEHYISSNIQYNQAALKDHVLIGVIFFSMILLFHIYYLFRLSRSLTSSFSDGVAYIEKMKESTSSQIQDLPKSMPREIASFVSDIRLLFKTLRETRDRLKASSLKILSIQEKERKRISQNLHDEVGQNAAALKLSLSQLEAKLHTSPADVKSAIQQIQQLIDQILLSAKTTIMSLRIPQIKEMGLYGAIDHMVQLHNDKGASTFSFVIKGTRRKLPLAIEEAIYRSIQEAITNVSKHASANACQITLEYQANWVVAIIWDDGVGIPTQQPIKLDGLGLIGMHERIQDLGGRLEIKDGQGKGTTIELRIPV